MNVPAVNGLRQAALALHAMGEPDRAWVLAALTVEQRESLQALLAELRELGIPQDGALLQCLLDEPQPAATRPSVLDQANPAELEATLQHEPVRVREVLLAQGAAPPPRALQEAVMRAVERRLALRNPERSSAVRTRAWWHKAAGTLRRFGSAA